MIFVFLFQSTPPYGGDYYGCTPQAVYDIFQSTPPYGGDRTDPGDGFKHGDFNPRPHTGATIPWTKILPWMPISIHAPIRGRRGSNGNLLQFIHFNPRPHTGATVFIFHPPCPSSYFNPRPHTGATVQRIMAWGSSGISIHAPIRGRPLTA